MNQDDIERLFCTEKQKIVHASTGFCMKERFQLMRCSAPLKLGFRVTCKTRARAEKPGGSVRTHYPPRRIKKRRKEKNAHARSSCVHHGKVPGAA
eukprot:scaffold171925_cov17-Tisochrysis_lutea.AAC.1